MPGGAETWLLTQGVLGVAVLLLIGAVIYLFRRHDARTDAFITVISDVKAALQASTAASNANALAMEGLRSVMETRGHVMEGISKQLEAVGRQVEAEGERTRDRLPGGRA